MLPKKPAEDVDKETGMSHQTRRPHEGLRTDLDKDLGRSQMLGGVAAGRKTDPKMSHHPDKDNNSWETASDRGRGSCRPIISEPSVNGISWDN